MVITTTIRCLCRACRDWLNDMCSRRTVKVVGMKCYDFNRRRSQFGNVTTTVLCDNKMCLSNYEGKCTMKELYMDGDGCKPAMKEGEGNVEGTRHEGDRQIPIRH